MCLDVHMHRYIKVPESDTMRQGAVALSDDCQQSDFSTACSQMWKPFVALTTYRIRSCPEWPDSFFDHTCYHTYENGQPSLIYKGVVTAVTAGVIWYYEMH